MSVSRFFEYDVERFYTFKYFQKDKDTFFHGIILKKHFDRKILYLTRKISL